MSSNYIELTNHLSELRRLSGTVDAFCSSNGLACEVRDALQLCLDEVATNIIFYAFPIGQRAGFSVQLTCTGNEIEAVIRDRGVAFDPLQETRNPDVQAALQARPVGGLGVHFVKHFMDDLEYTRAGDENVLLLRKRLPPKEAEGRLL